MSPLDHSIKAKAEAFQELKATGLTLAEIQFLVDYQDIIWWQNAPAGESPVSLDDSIPSQERPDKRPGLRST